jgi:hypothetical protein
MAGGLFQTNEPVYAIHVRSWLCKALERDTVRAVDSSLRVGIPMEKVTVSHCHACRKPVEGQPRVCPRCGAPNPTLTYNVTKKIMVLLGVVILVGIVGVFFHPKGSPTDGFSVGGTYPVTKVSRVCLTVKALTNADQKDITKVDDARELGCLLIDPAVVPSVQIVDKNNLRVKVRILAPDSKFDQFEGWTDADNVGPDQVN